MTEQIRRVAIVGANLAGGRTAEALRAEGFEGAVTLIGDEPHRPYERPPLSKEILRGEWPAEKAFLQPEQWYLDNDIDLRLGVRATSVEDTTLVLDDGDRVEADAVVLCTGGRARTLPIPGADLEGVRTLRTIEDARAIAERLEPDAPIVVIGAGFIGAEVAASARTIGCAVTLLEVAPVPLERALGRQMGEIYAAVHREHGVDLRTGARVERLEGSHEVERVVLADGTAIDARAVVIGVGIEPNIELAQAAGIACSDGILVDGQTRTSHPRVFAAGDVAEHPNPVLGERIRIEHWQNAQFQPATTAKTIVGAEAEHRYVPWFWSDQYDVNMQMAGHPRRWDALVFRGDVEARDFVAFYLDEGRLVAALGLNRGKDVRGARALIEAGVTPTRDQLEDGSVDLRRLARESA